MSVSEKKLKSVPQNSENGEGIITVCHTSWITTLESETTLKNTFLWKILIEENSKI